MSNDPLARSDIWTGAPSDAEYDAVYAAVTATERGRWFLTEYANRNRHADTDSLVAAMARIEAGIVANEGVTANMSLPLDLAAAAERIQDIAFGLRERAVDPALCDALDAAAREISQALANGTPAAVEDAAAVLVEAAPAAANENGNGSEAEAAGDLPGTTLFDMEAGASKRFTEAVAALATSLTSLPEAPASSPSAEIKSSAEPRSPPADVVIPPPDYAQASAPPPEEPPCEQTETTRRWHIEAPDFVFHRPSREADDGQFEANGQPSQAHPLLTATPLPLGPDEDPDDLFAPSPNGSVDPQASAPASPPAPLESVRTTPAELAPIVEAATPPQLRIANGAPISRPAPRDPLADIRSLSEDELIALFG
jgi:hypothetical protein